MTPNAVTVYCGSTPGKKRAYQHAAESLGKALVDAERQLVYGGGSKGIMGIISGTVLDAGGDVVGVIPRPMVAPEDQEGEAPVNGAAPPWVQLNQEGRERTEWILVDSMHERKVEMARRSCGFIGLPGGFGTFEEVFEVTTWTQLGIHSKPVVLANVLGYFDPVRDLIHNAIREGFIGTGGINLIKFVDGPSNHSLHETFDWGKALLKELDSGNPSYNLGFV